MGGSQLCGQSFCQQFPNASDEIHPEDDLIRSLRELEPEPIKLRFLYPIWKIISSHTDYLRLERNGEDRLEEIYLEINKTLTLHKRLDEIKVDGEFVDNSEKVLKGVAQKTNQVCRIIESHKNFLVKIFERTDYLKKLYFCRLKYIGEAVVLTEQDLLNLPIRNVAGQPGNEMITYAVAKDLGCMLRGYRYLSILQKSVQASLVESFNNLTVWHENFEELSLRCNVVHRELLKDFKK